jgi:hypothetical protein
VDCILRLEPAKTVHSDTLPVCPRNSRNSHEIPNALLRVSAGIKKKEALDERDTAKERLNFHEMTCPTCIHQRNLHSVK